MKLHRLCDAPKLAQLMRDFVIPLYALRTRRRGYEVSVMKEMMNQLGMAAGPVRPPLAQVTPEDKDEVKKMSRKWQKVLS